VREACAKPIKESHQFSSTAYDLMAEAEVAIAALREAMRSAAATESRSPNPA
jgi:hypothetical protein